MLIATKDLKVRHPILDKLTMFYNIASLGVVSFSIANNLASVDCWEVVIPKAYAEGSGLEILLPYWFGRFVVIQPKRCLVPERWPLKYVVHHWRKVGIM